MLPRPAKPYRWDGLKLPNDSDLDALNEPAARALPNHKSRRRIRFLLASPFIRLRFSERAGGRANHVVAEHGNAGIVGLRRV